MSSSMEAIPLEEKKIRSDPSSTQSFPDATVPVLDPPLAEDDEEAQIRKQMTILAHGSAVTDILPRLPEMRNVPSGLENLVDTPKIIVKQKMELLAAFTHFQTNNAYTILNENGRAMLNAVEETDWVTRQLLCSARNFKILIRDEKGPVLTLTRPCRTSWGCCIPALRQMMIVTEGENGRELGRIVQRFSVWRTYLDLVIDGEVVAVIRGPAFHCFGPVEYRVMVSIEKADKLIEELETTSHDEEDKAHAPVYDDEDEEDDLDEEEEYFIEGDLKAIGTIAKQWTGVGKEFFTETDNFAITVLPNLPVKEKALLMAATILLDFMYFEGNGVQDYYKTNNRF